MAKTSTSEPAKGWPVFLAVVAAAAAADLLSKKWIFARLGMPGEQPAIGIIPGLLSLETNLNEGALFGMGQGMGVVFATVSVAAIVGILALVSRPSTRSDGWILLALGLIVGGIIGNLFDRLGLPGLNWHAPLAREGARARRPRLDSLHASGRDRLADLQPGRLLARDRSHDAARLVVPGVAGHPGRRR